MPAEQESADALRHEFAALSSEALRANNDQFLALARAELGTLRTASDGARERGRQAFGQLVGPLRDSLPRVDGRLERLERDRVAGRAELSVQLRTLVESSERLRGETAALASALRQPQARGRWGEMQLRRVVELIGMTAHCDFVEQRTVVGEDGQLRPDLIVRLPGDRQVIIDAKAPLQSFLDALEAPGEEARDRHLAAHARVLREHMRRLGAKAYWTQFDAAPDFVVMFLPAEHFHQAALEAAPDLLEEGVREHVLLATPMTLIALCAPSATAGSRSASPTARARSGTPGGSCTTASVSSSSASTGSAGAWPGPSPPTTTPSARCRPGCSRAPGGSPSTAPTPGGAAAGPGGVGAAPRALAAADRVRGRPAAAIGFPSPGDD